jgi:vacuolar-type H+-ATPase catalytic subunit A/Vma1
LGAKGFFGEGEAVASDAAKRWRKLAAEARARAEEMADPQAKRIMSSIAEGYERLAKRADDRKTPKNSK